LRVWRLYAQGELEPAASEFQARDGRQPRPDGRVFYLGACYAAGGNTRGGRSLADDARGRGPASFVYALAAEAFLRARNWEAALTAGGGAAAALAR